MSQVGVVWSGQVGSRRELLDDWASTRRLDGSWETSVLIGRS